MSPPLKNPKIQLLLLLLLLAVIGMVDSPDALPRLTVVAVSLAAALLAEWAFFGAVSGSVLQSAAITGGLIGLLVSPDGNLTVAWAAAVAAIASKKLLLFHEGKHLFNPAAFGLLFSVLVFGNRLNWWGNSSVVLLVLVGGWILMRLHRFALPFSYFIARAATAALIGGAAWHSALLLPNLLFAFLMLVEPKSSPGKRSEQWIFGGLCGLAATISYRWLPAMEGDLLALLALNLMRPLIPQAIHALSLLNPSRQKGIPS